MIEFRIWARSNLNQHWVSKLIEGKDFEFTGRIRYHRFNEKSPSIMHLEVKYTAYNIIKHWFKENEKIEKEIIKWYIADKVEIYEETIHECKPKEELNETHNL